MKQLSKRLDVMAEKSVDTEKKSEKHVVDAEKFGKELEQLRSEAGEVSKNLKASFTKLEAQHARLSDTLLSLQELTIENQAAILEIQNTLDDDKDENDDDKEDDDVPPMTFSPKAQRATYSQTTSTVSAASPFNAVSYTHLTLPTKA